MRFAMFQHMAVVCKGCVPFSHWIWSLWAALSARAQLVLATVRAAGHQVPTYQPRRAYDMVADFQLRAPDVLRTKAYKLIL